MTTEDVHRVGEEWTRINALAFIIEDGKRILHELWISTIGETQWRPVPTVERNAPVKRPPAVVGVALPEADDDALAW